MAEKSLDIKTMEIVKELSDRGVSNADIGNILGVSDNVINDIAEGKYDVKLREIKEDYVELKSDYESLKILYERLGEKLNLVANEAMESKKALVDKEREYSELQGEVLFMKQDKKRIEFYCSKATDESKELKNKVDILNKEIIEAVNTSTILENQVFNLERDKVDLKQEEVQKYNKLRDEKRELEKEIIDIKSELNIKDNKILDVEKENIRLNSKIKSQLEELEMKDERIKDLEDELEESNENIAEIEEQNIMLEKHIKKINEKKFMGLFKKRERDKEE